VTQPKRFPAIGDQPTSAVAAVLGRRVYLETAVLLATRVVQLVAAKMACRAGSSTLLRIADPGEAAGDPPGERNRALGCIEPARAKD
jgi:hypothetical protein